MDIVKQKRILCLGKCCPDIITVVGSFPKEDTDQRALDYYWQRGGNASNSASVLGLLGADVEFFGTLIKSEEMGFLTSDFHDYGVNISNCILHEEGTYKCPVAMVILNKENGSRTILSAQNNFVELTFEDFNGHIDLNEYKWIHFEGRPNTEHMLKMMQMVATHNATLGDFEKVVMSLEVEKVDRQGFEQLMDKVDYVFVSKTFSNHHGYSCKEDAVNGLMHCCREGGTLICAWGEEGAAAKTWSHDLVTSPCFPPQHIVDTNSAGDTFNAATIYALCEEKCLKEAITFGCKVAGTKCGIIGNRKLEGLQRLL